MRDKKLIYSITKKPPCKITDMLHRCERHAVSNDAVGVATKREKGAKAFDKKRSDQPNKSTKTGEKNKNPKSKKETTGKIVYPGPPTYPNQKAYHLLNKPVSKIMHIKGNDPLMIPDSEKIKTSQPTLMTCRTKVGEGSGAKKDETLMVKFPRLKDIFSSGQPKRDSFRFLVHSLSTRENCLQLARKVKGQAVSSAFLAQTSYPGREKVSSAAYPRVSEPELAQMTDHKTSRPKH
ncbi:hypothetical protein NE237_005634 [Protea cynaroides]|uniref:Uncharacterized protein n=1 Tax=Protea cynaroides TaxID=273540 RepID=A0A9Q0QUE4_9MAGN|nr:hypothetical protein NE237_005634 [Protea cynaroides]